jgi:C-terminal processing protease CtpA/Prc
LRPLYVMLRALQQTLPNGVPSNDPSLPDLQTPLYVLVNSNTASAAEVLAAALKVD